MAEITSFGKKVLDTELTDRAKRTAEQQVTDFSDGPARDAHIAKFGTQEAQAEELRARPPAPSTAELMQQRVKRNADRTQRLVETSALLDEVREAEEAASEQRGHIADMGVGLARVPSGFFGELFEGLAEIDEWTLRTFGGLDFNPFDDNGWGYVSPATLRAREALGGSVEGSSPFRVPQTGFDLITDLLPKPERFSGEFVEVGGKFIAGFLPANRAVQALKFVTGGGKLVKTGAAIVAGGAADFAAFDGHEARLSDMIQASAEEGGMPDLSNAITAYLASDPNDTELEGRLKNVIEGGVLGAFGDAVFRGIKVLYHARQERIIMQVAKAVDEADLSPHVKTDLDAKKAAELKEKDAAIEDAKTPDDPDVKSAEDLATTKNAATSEEALTLRRADIKSRVTKHMELNPDSIVAFKKAVQDGDEGEALKLLTDFNEDSIDWSKIENADDIKQVLLATEEVFADLITEAKGGVQSNARTRILADMVNATGSEVGNLYRDVRGSHGLAARFYASMRTMMASAAEVKRAIHEARNSPQSAQLDANAVRAIQMHAAIQAEVKGAQTEIARAMQAFSMIKESAANNFKEFDEIFRETGKGGRRKWEKEMDKFLATNVGLKEINKLTNMTAWDKGAAMFIEYTINAMLSSPKTHVVNFVSNVLNTVLYTLDRGLGGSWRYLRHGDRAALREAKIDLYTKFGHAGTSWRLAKQAWREGAPVVDQRQRIEFRTRQAISIEGRSADISVKGAKDLPELGQKFFARKREVVKDAHGNVTDVVEFNVYQRVINTIGRFIRAPGRALITGDEFFKAVNREAEIQVQSFRQADGEAIDAGMSYGSKKYEAYVEKRVKKLSNEGIVDAENLEIQSMATDKARKATFQESPQTKLGSAAEQLVNSNRWVKLIFAPFFRTPMNILRQGTLDRTPLSFLMDASKEIMENGHPRAKAELQARAASGVGAMAAFYMLTSSGEDGSKGFEIVGKLPRQGSARHANVKDYSIRFGDRWFQFNRLEPFGMWLGMVADMRTHTKYHAEDDDGLAYTLGAGVIASYMNNVGGKTFMKSISDFQDLLEGTSEGSKSSILRAVNRMVAGEFGKLVPAFVKGINQATHSPDEAFAKEAWDFLDIMSARSHAMADDIALRFDALGQPVPEDIGWSALINPFTVSEDRLDDPVYKEFFDTGFDLRSMPKSLGGGAYQLNSEEYSKLNGFMAKTGTYEALHALVTSPEWGNFNINLRKMLMKKLITEGRQTALLLLIGDGDMAIKFSQAKVDVALLITDFE